MNINLPLNELNYSFIKKPLLIGGLAMEYYGLRKAGDDIDLIATEEDVINLIKIYPSRVKDLWGDLGVCPLNFEVWKSICLFDYDALSVGAIEEKDVFIVSLEKLLLMKACAIKKEKYLIDTKLVAEKILKNQFNQYTKINSVNAELLKEIEGLIYIEKIGPKE